METCCRNFIFIFCLFFGYRAFAQTGEDWRISGKVQDTGGQPVEAAGIGLEGTAFGAYTDEDGNFSIGNVPPGNYSLNISMLGYEPYRQEITVSGDLRLPPITLRPVAASLQQVEIIGRKETSYKNTSSFVATKTATALKDVPQAISYVTKELMLDQQSFRTGDVVKNISGVNQFSSYDDFSLRGFRSNTQLINGLRANVGFWQQPLVVNLERVEVLKGPAGALFGNTDPGGTINRVTKKPLDVSRQSVNFAVGSFSTYRTTGDFTGPLNKERTLLYRLNLGYENTESFRKLQGSENMVIAPSISFIPNEKTRVNVDLVYSSIHGKLDRGQAIFGASAGTQLNSTPIDFAIAKANDYQNLKDVYVTASLNHRFTQDFSLNLSYLKYFFREDLMEHRTSNDYAVNGTGEEIPDLMQMQTIRRISKSYNDNLTAYLVKDLNTGRIKHKLLLGYDYTQFYVPAGGASENARGYRNAHNTGTIDTYDPEKKEDYLLDENGNPVPNVPHFNLAHPDYSMGNPGSYFLVSTPINEARSYSHGVYLQDQIKLDRWSVLLGIRQEFYTDLLNMGTEEEERIEQQTFIPRLGLVYAVTPHINAYGTYVQGFQPQNAESIANPATGGPFDPLVSNMIEFGAKGEFLDERLSVTLALYQIEQNNVLVNANEPGNPDLLEQRGQERGRGVEVDAAGKISDHFNLIFNYSFSETIVTESDDPVMIGRLKENAPRHQGGIWMRYDLSRGLLRGIGFGAGANFVTERTTFEELILPGYAVVDAAVYYKVDKFQVSLNLRNLADKTHWVGGYSYHRLYPGAPRNYMVGISYIF